MVKYAVCETHEDFQRDGPRNNHILIHVTSINQRSIFSVEAFSSVSFLLFNNLNGAKLVL